jgi:flavin-dependent dehydrogenase
MTYDALIIGGGPAGATAAILLARSGWSVAVIEKKRFPRGKVCGEFISATSLPLLRELGVLEAFRAAAGPEVRRVAVFAGEAIVTAPMPSSSRTVEGEGSGWGSSEALGFGRALGREHLDRLLLDAAARAGADIHQPASAQTLRRDGDAYACTVEADAVRRDLRARVVIAAHGSWEGGSLPTQCARSHEAADLLAFKAHFRDSALPSDLMPLLAFPGGYGGMVATDAGRVSLSCCIRRDALQAARRLRPGPAGEAVLDHIRRACRGADAALGPARLDGPWLAAGPIRPGIRVRRTDGLFVIGNAAGEAHPIVAEGISMAMQSAWLLCRRLLADPGAHTSAAARAAVGAAYAADWQRTFAVRLRASALFAQFAVHPAAAALVLPVIRGFPGILTFGARVSGKVRMIPGARPFGPETLANAGSRR